MSKLFSSWKTSFGGILSIASTILIAVGHPEIGAILTAVSGAVIGLTARDNDVSSQDVGIRPAVKATAQSK